MKNNSCDNGLIGSIKKFLQYINIFDIPRLTREISCDVKHIREKYDETMHAIEKYKEDYDAQLKKIMTKEQYDSYVKKQAEREKQMKEGRQNRQKRQG